MDSVESTAEVMSPLGSNMFTKVQSIMYFTWCLSSVVQVFKGNKGLDKNTDKVLDANINDIHFTGQYSDIAFADLPDSNKITENEIFSCCEGDKELYDTVIQNYYKAVSDGNINLEVSKDNKEISFSLSEKGKNLIQQDGFIEQFKKDQCNYFCNKSQRNTACINMTGNNSDINIFRYVDSFNINSVCDNGGKSQIQKMIIEWEKYGFVRTDTNGNVIPTEKCFDYFEQQDLRGSTVTMNVEKVSPSNLNQVAETAKKASDVSIKADKATNATVKTAKTSATAAKTGAATASGVATAGVGTAAMAVVELGQNGLNFMQRNIDFKAKNTTNFK